MWTLSGPSGTGCKVERFTTICQQENSFYVDTVRAFGTGGKVEKFTTICQQENSFYVDTVRAFRDRR